jgi:hypothetical protein
MNQQTKQLLLIWLGLLTCNMNCKARERVGKSEKLWNIILWQLRGKYIIDHVLFRENENFILLLFCSLRIINYETSTPLQYSSALLYSLFLMVLFFPLLFLFLFIKPFGDRIRKIWHIYSYKTSKCRTPTHTVEVSYSSEFYGITYYYIHCRINQPHNSNGNAHLYKSVS